MSSDSEIVMNRNLREETFRNNPKLDSLIFQLRNLLEPVEAQFAERYEAPRFPVVLVIGNSRSGSTLLTQILAATEDFSYPSNVLNRFAYAPALGAMIQQLLFNKEYAYLDELADIQSVGSFTSQLGKTKGAMGVSEFYHFWRRFVPNFDLGHLDEKSLKNVDFAGLRRELAAIEAVLGKPFMCKGKAIQYNLKLFFEHLPELFFVHIERDPLYVMQSTLLGRRTFYRSDDIWFGVKPAEYQALKSMDIYHQIAGQVLFTDRNIHSQLASIPAENSLHCHYEELCANPTGFYEDLRKALEVRGHSLTSYSLNDIKFESANTQKLEGNELSKLQAAYEELASQYPTYSVLDNVS